MRKRPRSPTAPALVMAHATAELPSVCLANVLSHLVGPDAASHSLYPEPFALAPWHRAVARYALVCREWRAVTAPLAAQLTRSVARIDVTAAVARFPQTGDDFARIDRHPLASDLRLVMRSVVTLPDNQPDPTTAPWFTAPHDYDDALQLHNSHRVLRSMGSIVIDWRALLTPRTSHLVRLDLSQTPLDCAQLGRVLHAASTTCPLVRVLVLPKESAMRYSEDNEGRETNLNELYGALQRWHRAHGGLVHLRIPLGRFDENTAVRLLRALIAYCPEIEFLDGWQDTYHVDGDGLARCEAYWPAPAHWWDTFWRTCTKLRTFHTVVMPFDDAYVGGLCPRGVETLVFGIDSAKARHYEVSRHALSRMALTFQGLQRLRLELPFVRGDVWDPRTSIGDDFVCAVTISSPQLREFRLQCLDTRVLFTIGLRSVAHLARLEHLEIVELQRLQAFEVAMAIGLMDSRAKLELAVSFAAGESEAWQLLRFLADTQREHPDTATSFSVSLWWLGAGYSGDGIRQDEVYTLVQRLSAQDIQVAAHAKRRADRRVAPVVVDLAHLEIHHGQGHPTARDGDKSTRHFAFPVCGQACVSEDSYMIRKSLA